MAATETQGLKKGEVNWWLFCRLCSDNYQTGYDLQTGYYYS